MMENIKLTEVYWRVLSYPCSRKATDVCCREMVSKPPPAGAGGNGQNILAHNCLVTKGLHVSSESLRVMTSLLPAS